MDLREFAVDPATYQDGKRIDFADGFFVRVRSAGSEQASKVRERLWKPYAAFRNTAKIPLETLNAQWAAQGLLSEIAPFSIDGKEYILDLALESDQKALSAILARPEFVGLRSRIIGIAIDESNFQAEIDGSVEKNSAGSRTGSSDGANTPNE
jgi:hypothetical protein